MYEEAIGDVPQAREGIFVKVAYRLIGAIGACHHEGIVRHIVEEKMVQRRVWKHQADRTRAWCDSGREVVCVRLWYYADWRDPRCEHVAAGYIDIANSPGVRYIANHRGERFVFACLPDSQFPASGFVSRIACQMVSTQAF